MKEILKLVEEIESWNDGDADSIKQSEWDGMTLLDLETVKARAKVIKKLKKMLAS